MAKMTSFFTRYNYVKQIPVFADVKWFDMQRIARKALLEEYSKGDIISKEGSPPDFFYCLLSGRLQAYTISFSGKKENIDFIHRGMHFGIISVLTGENHSLTFEAINDSVVLKIPKDDFNEILKSIPQLGLSLSQSLSKRVRRKVKGVQSIFESTIISVYSPVQGTGSSTYAINLALNLQRETQKKLIYVNIHSNKQNDASEEASGPMDQIKPRWKRPAVNISEIVGEHEKIVENIFKDEIGIDVINVAFDAVSETEPRDEDLLRKQISPFVSSLVGDYHYVVVDLPNDMDDVVFQALTQSDVIHLVTCDRKKDLNLIRRVIDRLQMTLKANFKEEKVKVVIRSRHEQSYLSSEEINQFMDYAVYETLPLIKAQELTGPIDSKYIDLMIPDQKSEYSLALRKIARSIGEVLVGLVLGGGAALGVAHIGVIRVLEEENIPIDIVVGSSMGALIAGIWATGKNAKELEAIALEFEKKVNMLKLFDPVIPVSGLIGGHMIKRWLRKHLGDKTFYNTRIPLKIVAYDIKRRHEIVINSGSIVSAIRKSIAIPGVIEPIKEDDQVIIDGGVLNPLPTNVLASLGIKKIIAVNVLQSPEDVSESYDIHLHKLNQKKEIPFAKAPVHYVLFRIKRFFGRVFDPNIADIIVKSLQATEYVIAQQSAQQADVVIHPDLVGIDWYELDKAAELIKNGELATRQLLPKIKELIED